MVENVKVNFVGVGNRTHSGNVGCVRIVYHRGRIYRGRGTERNETTTTTKK